MESVLSFFLRSPGLRISLAVLCLLSVPAGHAESSSSSQPVAASEALPDAPVPQGGLAAERPKTTLGKRLLNTFDPGYEGVASKWDTTITKGVKVRPFSRVDKLHYALVEEFDPYALFSASWAAGYEHLRDANPHYGSDKAGFGERLGAAAFRQGVNRMFGDGIFPALTGEDPRYYRVAEGSLWYRASRSAVQTLVRHRDDGTVGVNYSGLAGHLLADGLPITFYPEKSAKTQVVLTGFGTSLAADAGLKLFREFIPDVFRTNRFTTDRK